MAGRLAPAPTIVGKRGGPKLSPYFTEWLMALPAGHVTAVPGLSVNDMLRLCGNGVVPAQAAAAYRWLLHQVRAALAHHRARSCAHTSPHPGRPVR